MFWNMCQKTKKTKWNMQNNSFLFLSVCVEITLKKKKSYIVKVAKTQTSNIIFWNVLILKYSLNYLKLFFLIFISFWVETCTRSFISSFIKMSMSCRLFFHFEVVRFHRTQSIVLIMTTFGQRLSVKTET